MDVLLPLQARRGVVPQAFSPLSLSPAAWYRPESLSALSDGDPVGTWTDSSGNGRDLVQATAGKKPTYKTAIIGGRAVVRTDGVDDYLEYVAGANWITGTTLTVIGIRATRAVSASAPFVSLSDVTGGNDYVGPERAVIGEQPTGGGTVRAYRNFPSGPLSTATWPGSNVAYVESHVFDGTNHTIYINGAGGTPVASTGSFTVARFYMAARWYSLATMEYADADIGEWMVFLSALSGTDRPLVESYLRLRWGTP